MYILACMQEKKTVNIQHMRAELSKYMYMHFSPLLQSKTKNEVIKTSV